MKQVQRIAALALVVGAALIGGMLGGRATDAGAAGSNITCAIPNNVVCTVSNPLGIKSVKVNVNFGGGIGNVAVVDETYVSCPKSVNVHWDPIVPNYAFTVEACSGLKVTNGQPPVVGEKTTAMIIAVKPNAGFPGSGAFVLKTHGDPKPLGLTSKPGTSVFSYPETCSWSQEGNTFVLCDQQYVLGCKLLGGTWTNDGCDGANEGPGGSHPGPKPGGD
jgi:hypothetical protein